MLPPFGVQQKCVPCDLAKYSKCSNDLLKCVFSPDLRYVTDTGNEWVCKTCDRALKHGVMPLQAKANGLQLSKIPPELSDLNTLELKLICLRLPFMKMVALPSGKQRSIHGPAVNVPSKVDAVCNILPRLPYQSELVPLKLKRKLAYKGHYMYDYITPQKLLVALRFLKANNPLYADINVNEKWLEAAMTDDAELGEHLLKKQYDSDDKQSQANQTIDSKPIVANVPPPNVTNEVSMECDDSDNNLSAAVAKLHTLAEQYGFVRHHIPANGDCMFGAIAYQLNSQDICDVDSCLLREMAADVITKLHIVILCASLLIKIMTTMQTQSPPTQKMCTLIALQTHSCKLSLDGKNI